MKHGSVELCWLLSLEEVPSDTRDMCERWGPACQRGFLAVVVAKTFAVQGETLVTCGRRSRSFRKMRCQLP